MVAPECAPAAKAGGLGDVVFGLSRELEIRGTRGRDRAAEVCQHALRRYLGPAGSAIRICGCPGMAGRSAARCGLAHVHGRKCFFIEPHSADNFFDRDLLYGYPDDAERFTFFSKAALEFMLKANMRPDVIHCHDWQTGLVPVLLYEQYREVLPDQRVCYTIHNFSHQGVSGPQVLAGPQLGQPRLLPGPRPAGRRHLPRAANLMKGGVVYSNFVATVSPNHAGEARHGDGGFGLGQS